MAAAIALGVAPGCTPRREEPSRPNLLLIVVDTLRADRLGCYGAARDTSPSIDALAAGGVRFERAYSTAPWTKPSVASILTGLYPSGHGTTSIGARLPDAIPLLPEILQARGYRTGGVVSGHFLAAKYGFRRGFEVYDQSQVSMKDNVTTDEVTQSAIAFLEGAARESRPFFLFVHYFDPHYNYRRHAGIDFAPPRAGRLRGGEDIRLLRRLLPTMRDAEVRFLLDLYDGEVRFTDAGIGRLLDAVRRAGVYDDTVIVLTADHGEEFLDHGWLGHTRSLYEELLRVPLIVKTAAPPGGGGRVVQSPVSVVSLVPTILDLLEVEHTKLSFHDDSIVDLLRSGEASEARVVHAEVDFVPIRSDHPAKEAFKKTVIDGRFKLIRDDPTGAVELYDLVDDPGERKDLAPQRPEVVARLRTVLESHLTDARRWTPSDGGVDVSPEEAERLRSLGYGGD